MLQQDSVVIPERFKSHPLFNTLHKGMNFGFMAKRGYYAQPEVQKQPQLMAKCGVNWSTLNVNICQETYASRRIFQDYVFTSSEQELSEMAKRLHDNGIHILLKPCLTPLDGAWMGAVTFPVGNQIQGVQVDYWKEWFASFTEALKYYADFAQRNQIEGLIIGAEYYGTEGRAEEWSAVIDAVRDCYSGPITYEFIIDSLQTYSLKWFEKLDFLSYSYYPPARPLNRDLTQFAASPKLSLEEMVDFLQPNQEHIREIVQRFGRKPIAFTEIGVRSAHGCTALPSDFLAETAYDGEEQADYMEAVLRTYSQIPQWLGLYWWKWDETQNRPHYKDPAGDKGFTIQGKPAENVLKKWFT